MPNAPVDALERARRVRLMVFDVDGVLTDGRLWYGPQGETLKAFSARDGMGMRLLAESGVTLALLTSRRSEAVALRAAELADRSRFTGIRGRSMRRLSRCSRSSACRRSRRATWATISSIFRCCAAAASPARRQARPIRCSGTRTT
jgi:hypothetical protein